MGEKVFVPPIKIQGTKRKLVFLIKNHVRMKSTESIWVEPFMGSGIVGFNILPKEAIFADKNPHIISFYSKIKNKEITSYEIKSFLTKEGEKLRKDGMSYYYSVRKRFNKFHNPLDFLFLNRSCFNGMIRFNKNENFNVPYCHKDERFSKSYITKIVNQVINLENYLRENNWNFVCQSFEKTILEAPKNSFFYCDPPYIDRNNNYYDNWGEKEEKLLYKVLTSKKENYMISTWDHNKYRKNQYIDSIWKDCFKINKEHFYYVGGKEENRHAMTEALLINYRIK